MVEARPEAADEASREAAAGKLARHRKERLGVSATVRVREPGAVERSAGKPRRVLDLRRRP